MGEIYKGPTERDLGRRGEIYKGPTEIFKKGLEINTRVLEPWRDLGRGGERGRSVHENLCLVCKINKR